MQTPEIISHYLVKMEEVLDQGRQVKVVVPAVKHLTKTSSIYNYNLNTN